TQYSKKFDDDKKYIDTKFEDFKKSVSNSEVITTGQTANWQRYKLTEADGKSIFTNLNNDLEKLRNLTPGYFYCTNIPISGATSTAGFVIVEMRDTSVKRITFSPYNSTDQYLMRFYNSWSDWERVGIDPNNVETPQNSQAKANTAENNAKVYTDLKYSKRHTVLF
ncbi:pyocin knob domain-containing protein, partial [Vibrio toranzoniae]|uniref:pyocin knob domain-containing protein n=3 Tax=Bacteria TaxID=2 RepID=UPI001929EA52